MNTTYIIVTLSGFSFFSLYLGLDVLIRRKPLFIPSSIFFGFIFLLFGAQFVNLSFALSGDTTASLLSVQALFSFFAFLLVLGLSWYMLHGYSVFGIAEDDLREALVHAVDKNNVSYSESLSGIQFPQLDNKLTVNMHPGTGTAQIRMRKRKNLKLFKRLITDTKEYIGLKGFRTDLKSVWVNLLIGILTLAMTAWLVYMPLSLEHRFAEQQYESALERLESSTSQAEHNARLSRTATAAFDIGNYAEADGYAREILAWSQDKTEHWNYGNAIHDGNSVLGRIALAQGRVEDAAAYLLRAAESPGSPQLNSFGPDIRLAQDLSIAGETEAVLAYLESIRSFWDPQDGTIERWIAAAREGRKLPDKP